MASKPKKSTSIPVYVDVCLHEASSAKPQTVAKRIRALLDDDRILRSQPLDISSDVLLASHCLKATVSVPRRFEDSGVASWKATVVVNTYKLNHDVGSEHLDDEDTTSAYQQFILPHAAFDGLWENLHFDSGLKEDLISYASSAMVFAQKGIDQSVIACNRMVLLYGPPGTGKTTLCKSLAQQLSIRLQRHYPQTILVEINSHSLFSKWFSESGKLIQRLFTYLEDLVNDDENLVCILIDEVESLAMSRKNAVASNEPADSVRAVNALLTQLDKLSRKHNVLLLTTTNITTAIDDAFLDRADVRRFVGYPGTRGRFEVLGSCVREMTLKGILSPALASYDDHPPHNPPLSTSIASAYSERSGNPYATLLSLPSLLSVIGGLRVRVNARWIRSTAVAAATTPPATDLAPISIAVPKTPTAASSPNTGETSKILSLPFSSLLGYYDALSHTDLSSLSPEQVFFHNQYCNYTQWLLFFAIEELLWHTHMYSARALTDISDSENATAATISISSGPTRVNVPSALTVLENLAPLYDELASGKRLYGIIDKVNRLTDADHPPGIVSSLTASLLLLSTAIYARGLSGRSLRKLPFQAHSLGMSSDSAGSSKTASSTGVGAMDSLEALIAAGDVSLVASLNARDDYASGGAMGADASATYSLANSLALQSLSSSALTLSTNTNGIAIDNTLCGSEQYLAFLHLNNNLVLPRDTLITKRVSLHNSQSMSNGQSSTHTPHNTHILLPPLPQAHSFMFFSDDGCAVPLDVYLYALRHATSARKTT